MCKCVHAAHVGMEFQLHHNYCGVGIHIIIAYACSSVAKRLLCTKSKFLLSTRERYPI